STVLKQTKNSDYADK
ncbi:TPA: 23S rRNA methyltransferase attenuation leader peptide, partial [Enterococcus faecium]|nr:23S rRNA methyltransferase attenuation leader peptide [Enterococcus faecalis]HCD3142903.1 23S rRNA methyltransferase attenuation leader peptide [Enterococcus faecium]HEM3547004.1 23S rRNA methyltransferase attenuation leader peptide [Streptococcus suis]HES3103043.1 23S rRNA methyltransferase attenuation leader peptide [Streptococcus pyogenes]HEU6503027.1 23S rRNA methyltransferase attenuation leader peptide [Streptococcus pneumoniae]